MNHLHHVGSILFGGVVVAGAVLVQVVFDLLALVFCFFLGQWSSQEVLCRCQDAGLKGRWLFTLSISKSLASCLCGASLEIEVC